MTEERKDLKTEIIETVQIIKCKGNEHRHKAGIHIDTPTTKKLQDALEDAERKGFSAIYVHM